MYFSQSQNTVALAPSTKVHLGSPTYRRTLALTSTTLAILLDLIAQIAGASGIKESFKTNNLRGFLVVAMIFMCNLN